MLFQNVADILRETAESGFASMFEDIIVDNELTGVQKEKLSKVAYEFAIDGKVDPTNRLKYKLREKTREVYAEEEDKGFEKFAEYLLSSYVYGVPNAKELRSKISDLEKQINEKQEKSETIKKEAYRINEIFNAKYEIKKDHKPHDLKNKMKHGKSLRAQMRCLLLKRKSIKQGSKEF